MLCRVGSSGVALRRAVLRHSGNAAAVASSRGRRLDVCLPLRPPLQTTGAESSRRRFTSGPAGGEAGDVGKGRSLNKREPVDTTTALDEHRDLRRVERRIEEHLRAQRSGGGDMQATTATGIGEPAGELRHSDAAKDAEGSGALAEAKSDVPIVPGQPPALRLNDPDATSAASAKDVIVRSHTTTGQVLWPATKEDIEILSQSKLLYPAPYEVEGSVIIRLVRLSDPVTSPVARTVRNRQFGIRGNERWQLLAMGVAFCGLIYSLGFWQLRRMEWKQKLIELRRTRLAMPRLLVAGSPFPWRDKVQDYAYRIVEVRGVFDHRREMHVGPRPGSDSSGETHPGFLVVTPLRLEDSSTVLVNRGHLPTERLDQSTRPEVPKWVRVKGVLEEGEIPNLVGKYARLKNRPDRNQFTYLVAEDLAENSGARNHQECTQALITAIDVMYEDDFQAGVRREFPFSMRHKEDYLLFWADEHTHFNYAMQWFGMGTLIMTMTIYKFIEVSRWRF